MKYNFCTLFDKNYLYRGLVLYFSLKKNIGSFHLWILCMDDETYHILQGLHLSSVELIESKNFEDKALQNVKDGRTAEEYCWTCTPSLPLYILRLFPKLDNIGYLDADLFFFSDPQPIYTEWGKDSILIIPHNFPPFLKYKELTSGKFNVSMVLFKKDTDSLECLRWWREKCIEWCYRKFDHGRLGDQLYLNSWPDNFKGVHVLNYKGGGVGPWNIMNYRIRQKGKDIFVDNDKLIFYHFHGLRMLENGNDEMVKGYEITRNYLSLVYDPYIVCLEKAKEEVRKISPNFNYGFSKKTPFTENLIDKLYVTKLKMQRYLWKFIS